MGLLQRGGEGNEGEGKKKVRGWKRNGRIMEWKGRGEKEKGEGS